jgi:hypothetical protein
LAAAAGSLWLLDATLGLVMLSPDPTLLTLAVVLPPDPALLIPIDDELDEVRLGAT